MKNGFRHIKFERDDVQLNKQHRSIKIFFGHTDDDFSKLHTIALYDFCSTLRNSSISFIIFPNFYCSPFVSRRMFNAGGKCYTISKLQTVNGGQRIWITRCSRN